jgi:hypothetical protein
MPLPARPPLSQDTSLGDALKPADPTIVADVMRQLRAAGFRELDDWRLPEEL